LTGDISEGGSGGFTYFIDGAVYLTPKFAVGVEGNFNLHGAKDANDDLKFRAASLYLAKAEYYFMDGSFSPFGGLGLGLSRIERPEATFYDENGNEIGGIEGKKKFNFAVSPRVGFVAGGFHMEFIYNLAGKEPNVDVEGIEDFSYNFWTISLGYRYSFEL